VRGEPDAWGPAVSVRKEEGEGVRALAAWTALSALGRERSGPREGRKREWAEGGKSWAAGGGLVITESRWLSLSFFSFSKPFPNLSF